MSETRPPGTPLSPTEISWRDWPARRRPKASLAAAGVTSLAVYLVAQVDVALAILGAILLLTATAEALLPTRYTLSPEGLALRGLLRGRRHPWSHFQRFHARAGAIYLEGAGSRALIRRRRSLWLHCPGREAAVTAALSGYMQTISEE